jgi:hypothetical protein
MPLIRNNKTARVGLPTESGKTLYFEPGTHEYSDEDLDGVLDQRASVRAYFESQDGRPAVLEEMGGGAGAVADPPPLAKKSVKELKAEIAESDDPDFLRSILEGDDRTTVIAAADKKLAELNANLADDPETE